ncbi:hypothetical protein LguiA_025834 [Lonicera macranthoides]
MTIINKSLLLILIFSLLLSYSIEALPAPSPQGNEATPSPSPGVESMEDRKKFVADKLKEALPKAEEYLQKVKKRIDETPGSSPSEQCLKGCVENYERAIGEIKNVVQNLSLEIAHEIESKLSGIRAESEKCGQCFSEVEKEDPEIKKYNEWFNVIADGTMDELNKYNS